MNVTLKPELESLIDADVKSGRAVDPSEFLNRAVFHYVVARDLGEEFTSEEMDQLISEGLTDIERGDVIEGNEAFRLLHAYSAERRQQIP